MPTSSEPLAATKYLHEQMPLTQAMGVTVVTMTDELAVIHAPLAPNLNHQQTAFGGSISALGITAGWVYLHGRLKRLGLDFRLIIQKSQVEYLHPVSADFEAHCIAPAADEWDHFIAMLHKKGRARINRASQIQCQGKVAAIHHGSYVAIDGSLARKTGVRG